MFFGDVSVFEGVTGCWGGASALAGGVTVGVLSAGGGLRASNGGGSGR